MKDNISRYFSIENYFLDDTINMKFINILTSNYFFIFIILTLLLIVLYIVSKINMIVTLKIKNENIKMNLHVKFLFNLININRQIYPPSKEKKTKRKGDLKQRPKLKVKSEDILDIYRVIKEIEIYEFYSNIEFGSKEVSFTSFIYVLINMIYGHIVALINPQKILLKVTPNYYKNYFLGDIKIHIRPKIRNILRVLVALRKIKKNNKEVDVNARDKFNSEAHGNNS